MKLKILFRVGDWGWISVLKSAGRKGGVSLLVAEGLSLFYDGAGRFSGPALPVIYGDTSDRWGNDGGTEEVVCDEVVE
jgi:hypothetical protein